MIGRLTFDRAQAIRGTFTRRYESAPGLLYSSTLIRIAWSLEQDLTRQRANRRAKKEEEEEEEGFCLRATTNVFTLLVEYVSDGSKTHRVIVKGGIN